ncbi:hypothetical protein [Streptomyces fagopyri]
MRGLPPALVITDSDALLDAANHYSAELGSTGVQAVAMRKPSRSS